MRYRVLRELSRRLNAGEIDLEQAPVRAAQLAALITRIADGTISNNAGKQVFDALWNDDIPQKVELSVAIVASTTVSAGLSVDAIIESKGLKQMNDVSALEKIIDTVIAANPKNVEEYRAGNSKALNALVGQIMKGSQGKANPQQAGDLLRRKLD